MKKSVRHEQRHQRGVLHRIPEPEAAPAERVISPPRAHGDADSKRRPCAERPWPHPARPACIDAALDQRGDRKRKGHRKADIARIEKRRMERSEEHTSELQSLMRISYAVLCLKKKNNI